MKYFVATYTHPDEKGWKKYLTPHIDYLEKLIADKKLVASGPLLNSQVKSAMIILKVKDINEAQSLIASDPYTIQDLVGASYTY